MNLSTGTGDFTGTHDGGRCCHDVAVEWCRCATSSTQQCLIKHRLSYALLHNNNDCIFRCFLVCCIAELCTNKLLTSGLTSVFVRQTYTIYMPAFVCFTDVYLVSLTYVCVHAYVCGMYTMYTYVYIYTHACTFIFINWNMTYFTKAKMCSIYYDN